MSRSYTIQNAFLPFVGALLALDPLSADRKLYHYCDYLCRVLFARAPVLGLCFFVIMILGLIRNTYIYFFRCPPRAYDPLSADRKLAAGGAVALVSTVLLL